MNKIEHRILNDKIVKDKLFFEEFSFACTEIMKRNGKVGSWDCNSSYIYLSCISKWLGFPKISCIFSDKCSIFQVAAQKNDIDRIGNVVIGATENIRDANEQINQAIQRNAGLRVYILFFLIVMSFTLLFLDWYND